MASRIEVLLDVLGRPSRGAVRYWEVIHSAELVCSRGVSCERACRSEMNFGSALHTMTVSKSAAHAGRLDKGAKLTAAVLDKLS